MRKLRLAALLPIFQVVLAAILLQWAVPPNFYWSEPVLICQGLNAPALLFVALTRWPPIAELAGGRVRGTSINDIFFLLGVVVVWYFVGRALDRKRGSRQQKQSGAPKSVAAYLVILAAAGILLYLALLDFQNPNFDSWHHFPERAVLTLAWSTTLAFISARGLLTIIRSRRAKIDSVDSSQ